IGGGADSIIIPEDPSSVKNIAAQIQRGVNRGKTSSIIVCAEGPKQGKSYAIANELQKKYGYKARVCILGHTQRGGSPTARDRKVASIMGAMAVRELLNGYSDFMTGIDGLTPQLVSLKKAAEGKNPCIRI
ncbi:MAG: 6-phosphofructokinase, partial [Bdellovibrionales bacterium]